MSYSFSSQTRAEEEYQLMEFKEAIFKSRLFTNFTKAFDLTLCDDISLMHKYMTPH